MEKVNKSENEIFKMTCSFIHSLILSLYEFSKWCHTPSLTRQQHFSLVKTTQKTFASGITTRKMLECNSYCLYLLIRDMQHIFYIMHVCYVFTCKKQTCTVDDITKRTQGTFRRKCVDISLFTDMIAVP